ncbi:MAG: hypothetical protein FWG66_10045, partial [Spirochaetes bacterium]|nr:hypothetical protein [Spirochaetota bacterium]
PPPPAAGQEPAAGQPGAAETADGQPAWRQAYAALLSETAAGFTDQWGNVFAYFFLYDIDGTGVPNLIVLEDEYGFGFLPLGAYTFADGVLLPIELADMPDFLTDLYLPPGDSGLVALLHGGDTVFFNWLELEAGGFRLRVSGMFQLGLEDPDDWYSPERLFYYIDGQEVSEDEFWSVFHRWNEIDDGIRRMWRMTEDNIQSAIFGG